MSLAGCAAGARRAAAAWHMCPLTLETILCRTSWAPFFGLHDRSRVRLPSHQQCFSLHFYDHSPCSLPDRGDSVTLLPITYVKPIFGKLQWGAEHLKRLAGSSACCWECSEIAPESSMMRTGMHCAPNSFGLQIEPKVSCSRTMHRARWRRRWRFSAMRSAPQTAQSGGSALRGSLSTSWTSPTWSVPDIAGKISADAIHIAVNLNGYTKVRLKRPAYFLSHHLATSKDCRTLSFAECCSSHRIGCISRLLHLPW